MQNESDVSDTTQNNLQNFTIATVSNVLQILVHNITQNIKTNPNHNKPKNNLTQDNTSTLSLLHTNTTQPAQITRPLFRNYDPLPRPLQNFTHTTPPDSLQQGSANTNGTTTLPIQ